MVIVSSIHGPDVMTSGVYSIGTFGYNAGPGFRRTWTGKDGRLTTDSNGRTVTKYNDYTVTFLYMGPSLPSVPYGNFINVCGRPPFANYWNALDDNILAGKLVGKIRGHDFNLAVFAGEGRELLSLATTNLLRIGYMILALKQGNLKSLLRQLGHKNGRSRASRKFKRKFRRLARSKNLAELWLELQYAWLPLLSDVYEAGKAYEKLTAPPRVERLRVSRVKSGLYNGSQSPSNWTGTGPYTTRKSIMIDLEEQLSKSRSLGLLNPLSVAWELVPFSFVVDWFVPVGTYIDNLGIIPSLKCRTIISTFSTYENHGVGTSKLYAGASSSFSVVELVRVAGIGVKTPAFPGFKPLDKSLSTLHLTNAIALVRGFF